MIIKKNALKFDRTWARVVFQNPKTRVDLFFPEPPLSPFKSHTMIAIASRIHVQVQLMIVLCLVKRCRSRDLGLDFRTLVALHCDGIVLHFLGHTLSNFLLLGGVIENSTARGVRAALFQQRQKLNLRY